MRQLWCRTPESERQAGMPSVSAHSAQSPLRPRKYSLKTKRIVWHDASSAQRMAIGRGESGIEL